MPRRIVAAVRRARSDSALEKIDSSPSASATAFAGGRAATASMARDTSAGATQSAPSRTSAQRAVWTISLGS